MTLKSLKPGVSKIWLLAIAGLMWSGVGIMLCRLAYQWLTAIQFRWLLPLELLGVVLSVIVYRVCFLRIAQKNIARLCQLTEKTCVFAFQRWKSYLLVGFMVILGIALRNLPVPKPYLAVVYTTIGGALLLSSLQYYGSLWRIVVQKEPCLRGRSIQ
jgi:hypothetical protein